MDLSEMVKVFFEYPWGSSTTICSIPLLWSRLLPLGPFKAGERFYPKNYSPSLTEITTAASLAHWWTGLLRGVRYMNLNNVDLASVPEEHLAALASCVTGGYVALTNVRNWKVILDNIKCELSLGDDRSVETWKIGSEETQALVQAMESRVDIVTIEGDVTLDIMALTRYNGQGRCAELRLHDKHKT